MFANINILAIVAAAVAAWLFGAVWYRAFATRWMDALGKTKDQLMPGGRRSISSMVIVFVADLIMAAVLARFGFRSAVIDSVDLAKTKSKEFDGRVSAITLRLQRGRRVFRVAPRAARFRRA